MDLIGFLTSSEFLTQFTSLLAGLFSAVASTILASLFGIEQNS